MSKPFSIGAERALIYGEITSASIEISDGFITSINTSPKPSCEVVVSEGLLSPGFIDCQINGIGNINFFDADREEMEIAHATLAVAR